ncbi:MAG: HisA/HisF-related TIM barrel protein [Nodosilinea sp.]
MAVDVRKVASGWTVHTHGGKKDTHFDALQWIEQAVDLGAGELLITSMDGDGTKNGLPSSSRVKKAVRLFDGNHQLAGAV